MKRNLCIGPDTGKIIIAAILAGGLAAVLCAAPLDGGYAAAPSSSASAAEKAAASREARSKVLHAAEKYLGTPYRFGGVSKDGLDCSGFIYLCFQDALGVSPPRSTNALYTWAERIPDEQVQSGDLLFFKTNNSGKISHAGIYIGGGRFIHSASEGPQLGVIYSSLSENYWAKCYVGAGRALPESDITDRGMSPLPAPVVADIAGESMPDTGGPAGTTTVGKTDKVPVNTVAAAPAVNPSPGNMDSGGSVRPSWGTSAKNSAQDLRSRLNFNAAIAPSWGGILEGGNVFRGFSSQLGLGAQFSILNQPMLFGLELRPEWDGGLGVFRLPLTLSWGLNEKFRIFFGPVLSFGNASMKSMDGETRYYVGGTSLFGTAGVTIAPVDFNVGKGKLAPYAEVAWQSYTSNNSSTNLNADIAAGVRFSTGIRYTFGGK